jgi:hypothetical protein
MNHLQGLIDRGHLDWFTNWRLNRVCRQIQKLETPMLIQKLKPAQLAGGGWRLRWAVHGPATELQKFCNKTNAQRYASIRRNCQSEIQAIQEYCKTAKNSRYPFVL